MNQGWTSATIMASTLIDKPAASTSVTPIFTDRDQPAGHAITSAAPNGR